MLWLTSAKDKGDVDRVVNNLKAHYCIKIDPAVFERWEMEV